MCDRLVDMSVASVLVCVCLSRYEKQSKNAWPSKCYSKVIINIYCMCYIIFTAAGVIILNK